MIILAVGHSRTGDSGGAASVDGTREHAYNREVAWRTAEDLAAMGIRHTVIDRYPRAGYEAAMQWLAGECRRLKAKGALELHFNAAGPNAHGAEYLHWPGSTGGIALANAIINRQGQEMPGTHFRREGGRFPRSSGDGTAFLRLTPCPAVLTEPFFGTNRREWGIYGTPEGKDTLARINALGIADWLGVAPPNHAPEPDPIVDHDGVIVPDAPEELGRVSGAAVELIKHFEGLYLRAYKCVGGVWTIGYGHTGLTHRDGTVYPGRVITEAEADRLLRRDLEDTALGVKRQVTVDLSSDQYGALVSFAFNVGLGAFNRSTMLRLLNRRDYEGAAAQFTRWTLAGGVRHDGLLRRRLSEQRLFRGERPHIITMTEFRRLRAAGEI